MTAADTGPLITWARAKQLELLQRLLGHLVIPLEVAEELSSPDPARPATALLHADWVEVRAGEVQGREPFPSGLGKGERAAIELAQSLEVPLLIDDYAARREAERRGLVTLTTLRLLAQSKRLGYLDAVQPVLLHMRQTGFWLSDPIAQEFLQSLGEEL